MKAIDSSFETLPKPKTNRFLDFGLPPSLFPPSPFTKRTTCRQLKVPEESPSTYMIKERTSTQIETRCLSDSWKLNPNP